MKSPFAIFRKHQKVLMVVLTGLAMFAFVVLDSLTQNIAAFPPIFGALVGIGVIWWLLSSGKKKEHVHAHSHHKPTLIQQYTWVLLLVGGAGGWMLGSSLQSSIGVQAAVKTSFGNVTEDELNQVITRRQIADEFLMQAFRAAHEGKENPPQYLLRNYLFNTGGDPKMEALMHILLMREAKKIDLTITNDKITDLINGATSDKLSPNAFKSILSQMRLSDSELMSLLREQMVSREMRSLLMPRHLATPEDYWDAFQKLNVMEELSVVPIAVESFLSDVPEPSEDELLKFFNENKEKAPGEEGPDSFGFRQPGRIKLAYLEIDYDTVEKEVPAVTDADVEKYYAEHKEEFRNQVAPAFPDPTNPAMQAPKQGNSSVPPGPALKLPGKEKPETKQEKPAKETPVTKPTTEKNNTEKKETEKKPNTEKPKTEKKATEKPVAPAKESPAPAPKAEKKTKTPKQAPKKEAPKGEKQSSLMPRPSGAFFASVKDEKPEQKKPVPEKPVTKKPAVEKTKSESPKPAPTKPEVKKPEATKPPEKTPSQTKEKPAPTKKEEKKVEPKPDDKPIAEGDTKVKMPDLPSPAPVKPLPEFKPLDEVLKEQIRAQLLDARVRERMKKLAADARGHMLKLNGTYAIAENAKAKKEAALNIQNGAKKYAKEHQLRYVETPSLSYSELEDSEDYPIGSSTEPAANMFERSNLRTVPQMHFGVRDIESLERQRYHIFDAEDRSTLNRFIHWQIAFKPSHIPEWDEKGVKEQVEKAWKQKQARKLAEKRANEVAELLKKSDKPWSEALTGQLETGKEGSASLNVGHTDQPFAWLTRSTAPNPNPFMPPPMELTKIPIIFDGVDNKFMRTIFRKLDNLAPGTVWGAEQRYIYVVRVENRSDMKTVREDFLAQRQQIFSQFSSYTMMIRSKSRIVARRWNEEFFSKYDVKWLDTENE